MAERGGVLATDGAARTIVRRGLTVRLALLGVVVSAAVFVGVYASSEAGVMDGVRRQAQSLVDLVVATRHWNAMYGGVWVSTANGAASNPILRELGVEPDLLTEDGETLTLRNPALMTREISEVLAEQGGATFRLTSLDPVNVANSPDAWEREQLGALAAGHEARETVINTASGRVYRYIVPLTTEEECLRCHAVRGDRVGEVRGAISVNVPLAGIDERRRRDAIWLGVLVLAGGAAFLGFVDASTRRTTRQLEEAEEELSRLATTDTLTGLANRRTILARLALEHERAARTGHAYGVLAIDIDHFKRVNDMRGHACGDEVLVEVARLLTASVRGYDYVGRTGGEEFLAIVPETDRAALMLVAERVRESVEAATMTCGEASFSITVSIGAAIAGTEEMVESVTARADAALYRAKDAGRNRVCADDASDG
ncbi:MAG: diguanylate cyclase [Coriobacteriia bacterium]|nr:diguanylate cyclase [Coriobacteriia bacterium]